MRFLLDENLSQITTEFLKGLGYDANSVRDVGLFSASDKEILEFSRQEKRVIITFDKDFSDLRTLKKEKSVGVIVLRTRKFSPFYINNLLDKILKKVAPVNKLVIVTDTHIRVRNITT